MSDVIGTALIAATGWDWGWDAMVAIGTLVLALMTGGLAIGTFLMAKRTKHEAEATKDMAEATKDMVEVARQTLSATTHPKLTVRSDRPILFGVDGHIALTVHNLGSGPATITETTLTLAGTTVPAAMVPEVIRPTEVTDLVFGPALSRPDPAQGGNLSLVYEAAPAGVRRQLIVPLNPRADGTYARGVEDTKNLI
jgi:hypothetical protein